MLRRRLIKIVISLGLVAGLSFVPGQSFGGILFMGRVVNPEKKGS
jgi:hypothetical protein